VAPHGARYPAVGDDGTVDALQPIMPGAEVCLPRVVLVGRPNAGKSTLFNRLLGRRKALVDPTPGVTRDPNQAVAVWHGNTVLLLDTGGFEAEDTIGLEHAVRERSLAAVRGATVVLYVLDGRQASRRPTRRRRANSDDSGPTRCSW